MSKITIAIDGYSSCGKSTLAKSLAQKLGYTYIDTGAMYRAATLYALQQDLISDGAVDTNAMITQLDNVHISFTYSSELGKSDTWLNGVNVEERIREMDISGNVSAVASIPEVRHKLVALQQEMGRSKGVVLDGRDIGTVVFPDAELKIFMTADPEIRAQRRFRELQASGKQVSLDEVRTNLEDRDYQDTHRETDPLRQAEDARVLDNSSLSMDEQLEVARQWAVESGAHGA